MEQDPFKEYIRQSEPGRRDKGYIWHTAIGLQAVDGLTPSKYLLETAIRNIEGDITIDQAQQLLDRYYEENSKEEIDDRTEEADKVSARIAKLLLEKAFSFTPTEYISIHRRLFQGIYRHAGKMRDYNITKKEWVLDGATVLYGSATELSATLDYDISQEKKFSYKGLSINEMISHLAFFVARLWQIHVFAEGNTRTTAVFFIKYLRTLGFDATNDIFAENAWYFRNALVRANYNDLKAGIHETTEFLELFLRNLLLNETNPLHNRTMHISGIFAGFQKQDIEALQRDIGLQKQDVGSQKQDIELQKQDICIQKQDIGSPKQYIATCKQDNDILKLYSLELRKTSFSKKTLEHIQKLYDKFGNERVFGRAEVIVVLGITESPASELIKKLREMEMILPVQGKGKGKYVFQLH
ncbi:MAG: Fic family protein [Eubacterium sp.]|nr:Fic family protein [Eubacterium sp.]